MSIAEAEKHLLAGDLPNALMIANQAIQLDTGNSFCRQFRAWVYQCIGGSSIALALVDYQRCLEERPDDSSIYIDRAIAHIRQLDYHLAIRDLTHAVQNSSSASPPSFVYWLRSLTYRLQHQFDKSLADLDKAICLEPDQIQYRISRADLLRHLHKDQLASSDCNLILSRHPDDPDANE
jgi:tetratricopeptide (TPR) repeat protein